MGDKASAGEQYFVAWQARVRFLTLCAALSLACAVSNVHSLSVDVYAWGEAVAAAAPVIALLCIAPLAWRRLIQREYALAFVPLALHAGLTIGSAAPGNGDGAGGKSIRGIALVAGCITAAVSAAGVAHLDAERARTLTVTANGVAYDGSR